MEILGSFQSLVSANALSFDEPVEEVSLEDPYSKPLEAAAGEFGRAEEGLAELTWFVSAVVSAVLKD